MDENKKRFSVPKLDIVYFYNDDIITISEYDTEDFLQDGDREKW